MGFPVYDSKTDFGSVVITPEIRACFSRMEPGEASGGHTHDLGHELFVVLEGRAEFEIDGETKELGPGQMCVALADQMHYVRVVGDKPMTMYFSVTPHVQPTHTQWSKRRLRGERMPHEFAPSDRDVTGMSNEEILDRHVDALQAIADAVQPAAEIHRKMAGQLKEALEQEDSVAATKVKKAMWDAMFPMYRDLFSMTSFWNDLSTR